MSVLCNDADWLKSFLSRASIFSVLIWSYCGRGKTIPSVSLSDSSEPIPHCEDHDIMKKLLPVITHRVSITAPDSISKSMRHTEIQGSTVSGRTTFHTVIELSKHVNPRSELRLKVELFDAVHSVIAAVRWFTTSLQPTEYHPWSDKLDYHTLTWTLWNYGGFSFERQSLSADILSIMELLTLMISSNVDMVRSPGKPECSSS